jgi:hypothetical protein
VRSTDHQALVCFLLGNSPEESTQHSQYGESLKSRIH